MKQIFLILSLVFCIETIHAQKTSAKEELTILISPNPSPNGFVTVVVNKPVTATIITIIGKPIRKSFAIPANTETRIDLNNGEGKVFLLKIESKDSDGKSQFVVRRVVVS